MIEGFSFGSIIVDGLSYGSDLIIFPDGRVQDAWRRHRGHVLSHQDIEALIASAPEVIVAGAGVNGRMKPGPGLADFLRGRDIRLAIGPNRQAVTWYNAWCRNQKVGACFHLTC